jgi:restriction system protein
MKLQMHKNSLFAILLRSPWWVSLVVAGALFAGLRLLIPPLYAGFFALPFLAIGGYAAWKALRAPSAASIERKLEAARALDGKAFAAQLEASFRGEGFEVTRLEGEDADFLLERSGTRILVACKRWKAARTGIEPLRQLKAAARSKKVPDCIYVVAGEVTPVAVSFAAENGISIFSGMELAKRL